MVCNKPTNLIHSKACITLSLFLCALSTYQLVSAAPANSGGQKRIVKWVDEKGVTHYGDRLPAQDVSKSNSVLNKQGVLVEKHDPLSESKNVTARKELDQALLEQQRKDNALLSTYTSEVEIDIARDRNLQLDEIALQGLMQSEKNALKAKAETLAYIEKLKKNKKPIPTDVMQEQKDNEKKILDVKDKITKMHKLMEDKRAKYAIDKQRYAEIKPKSLSLQDVQKKEAGLKELREWKAATEDKIARIQKEILIAKRSGKPVDDTVTLKLNSAQAEVLRADEEIRTTEKIISEMRSSMSGGKNKN